MRIFTLEKGVIIDLPGNHCLHVYEEGESGKPEVHLYDHFVIRIEGAHKEVPTITLDSEEYETKLVVLETEHRWKR